MSDKYGNILTIILVVLVIAILIGLGILTYNLVIKPKSIEADNLEAIEEFDKEIEEEKKKEQEEEEEEISHMKPPDESENPSGVPQGRNKKQFKNTGYYMVGYITIPKTNLKQAILEKETPEALDLAVVVRYPNSNPQLNQPGNIVIAGHNYRNGTFFSDNKKLATGDKIKISDNTGTELTYTIYEIFQTTPEDTSCYKRDTNGAIEVTLTTCTDDSKARLVILARAD